MNFSFFICEQIINLNSILSSAIRNLGEVLFNKNICFSSLIQELNSVVSVGKDNFNIFSLDGIIKSFASCGLLNLVFTYALRYVLIKVFVILSPFAILTLISDKSSCFFKAWLRSFLSLLLLQNFISIVLLVTFSIDYSNDTLSKLLYIGSIYALAKSNDYIKELLGGIYVNMQTNLANVKSLFIK